MLTPISTAVVNILPQVTEVVNLISDFIIDHQFWLKVIGTAE